MLKPQTKEDTDVMQKCRILHDLMILVEDMRDQGIEGTKVMIDYYI
jgi:hypothetical protein